MFSDDLAIRLAPAEPVWEALREWPDIAGLIGVGAVAAESLRAGVPVLRDVGAVDHAPYTRPPGHRRSFYIRLARGVLAVKGSEPLAMNFAGFLDELAGMRVHIECRLGSPAVDRTIARAELGGVEKFPILEGKVPGCVTLREAIADAQAAFAVQRAYVARHGEPARLPMPLFVGRWPEAVTRKVLAELRPRLRGRAWDVVEQSAQAGLGVYAYHYPTVPLRLAHIAAPDAQRGAEVRARLQRLGAPRAIFDGWLGLTARLLALGFVPKDPATLVTGDCLQVQNAVLDGGFADVESLIASSLLDDRALRDAVRRTVHELALTATRLLLGLWVSTVDMRDRLPDIYALVWNALGERFAAESPNDPRIAAILLDRRPAFDALVDVFEQAF
jgi:hypothetical protein